MDRTPIGLACPGTDQNFVVLTADAGVSQYGIGHPENTGDCVLYVVALDQNGVLVDELVLGPGDSRHWYWPPSNTVQIVAVCGKTCHGAAVLEYDTPIC
jgi:hypothetical protein